MRLRSRSRYMQKVNCSECGNKMDCPKTMLHAKEHICSDCIEFMSARSCPECEQPDLEITANPNVSECNFCGAIWHRIKPQMTYDGKNSTSSYETAKSAEKEK